MTRSAEYRAAYAEGRAIAYSDEGYAESRLCRAIDVAHLSGLDEAVSAYLVWLDWVRGDSD